MFYISKLYPVKGANEKKNFGRSPFLPIDIKSVHNQKVGVNMNQKGGLRQNSGSPHGGSVTCKKDAHKANYGFLWI